MTSEHPESKPISLFYSYSHKDEQLRKQLTSHLAPLRRNGLIADWHDRDIDVGEDWKKEIDSNLASADIILFLVSADFIDSDYCWGVELKTALERHDKDEAKVIPVILRSCRWRSTPFAKLQAAPTDAKAVTSWSDQDAAFDDVAGKIERVARALRARGAAKVEAAEENVSPPMVQKLAAQGEARVYPDSASIPHFAVFRDFDAAWCPEMVALPAGEFWMGSPNSERERREVEDPQHKVTISRRFALGRYPVTFEEYDHFCAATKREAPGDRGWGRGRRPVVFVNWLDAEAYCEWLSAETGQLYRLPSEAEWEYACRAGTTTRYSCGDAITAKQANYTDSGYDKTTEVDAYPPNEWGLCDMHGNCQEWVEDVWHQNYEGAPANGSAWTEGEGNRPSRFRVIRGGSWNHYCSACRSACRSHQELDAPGYYLGFRVARAL